MICQFAIASAAGARYTLSTVDAGFPATLQHLGEIGGPLVNCTPFPRSEIKEALSYLLGQPGTRSGPGYTVVLHS